VIILANQEKNSFSAEIEEPHLKVLLRAYNAWVAESRILAQNWEEELK